MTTTDGAIPVVAAVISRNGRVLLCQRHDGPHLPLHWEFPGGKIEPGEDPETALAREIQEELGVPARVGQYLATVTHRYPEKTVTLRFFRASLRGEPRALVHRALAWLRPDELADVVVPPPNAVLVRRLVQGELDIH